MDEKKPLSAAELADFRRLSERAQPWQLRWATTEGKKRRGMFVAIDIEHRKEVLAALTALELSGERGGPAVRRLLNLIEVSLPKDSQRLPGTQASLALEAKLTSTQASHAFKWLAAKRVLCCREATKGRMSPRWEVYAGYASCLPEAKVLAEMDRQNAQDFAPGSERSKELDAAFHALAKRAETHPDDFTSATDPRQRNFDA
jgi:hypothetical protein